MGLSVHITLKLIGCLYFISDKTSKFHLFFIFIVFLDNPCGLQVFTFCTPSQGEIDQIWLISAAESTKSIVILILKQKNRRPFSASLTGGRSLMHTRESQSLLSPHHCCFSGSNRPLNKVCQSCCTNTTKEKKEKNSNQWNTDFF